MHSFVQKKNKQIQMYDHENTLPVYYWHTPNTGPPRETIRSFFCYREYEFVNIFLMNDEAWDDYKFTLYHDTLPTTVCDLHALMRADNRYILISHW